jgi:FAD/FMN-containing dehydrogenase
MLEYHLGYGGPGTTNAIAIDLVELQHVSLDPTTWHAIVGGGCKLGDVTTKLHELGGRAFAHGICPGVGVGGHATIVRDTFWARPRYLGC